MRVPPHTRSHPCTVLPISWICMYVPYVVLSYQSARPAGYHPPLARSPLFQRKRALLRCILLPISRTRRLSPTASAVPPLSKKEGFCVVLRQLSPFLNLVPYFSLWSTTSNKRFLFACIVGCDCFTMETQPYREQIFSIYCFRLIYIRKKE